MCSCPFCNIVFHGAPAKRLEENLWTVVIAPLNPVVEGHVLVIPKTHVSNAVDNSEVTARTFRHAAEYAKAHYEQCNIITSVGAAATQSVMHLHVHIVPRVEGDGLALPWTGQKKLEEKGEPMKVVPNYPEPKHTEYADYNFTDQEWFIDDSDSMTSVVWEEGEICDVVVDHRPNSENLANAHLIAASPKMFHALVAVVKSFEDEDIPPQQVRIQVYKALDAAMGWKR